MITVKHNEQYVSISGHANFSKKGHDLVCAAITAIVFGAIESFQSINKNEIKIDNNSVMIKKTKMSNEDVIRINMMISQILTVANNYPKNVELIRSL